MTYKTWLASCVSTVLVLGLANAANAQDDDGSMFEEIVVTAKGRTQNLQDVPLAISVFTSADLDERGIDDVQNLADFTPNLEISSATGRRDTTISIRGLGASTTDEKYQSVGFFVDGIWMGGQIVGLSTADVERIEIIKGPHSTFGRATYGASIDYVTKTPSLDEVSGSVRAQISKIKLGVDPSYELTGSVAGPLIPGKVSASFFAQHLADAGVEPAVGGQTQQVGRQETTVLSAVLYSEFGERTSLKLRGMYTNDSDTFVNGFESRPQFWIQQGSDVVQNEAGQSWVRGAVPDPIRKRFYSGDFRPGREHIDGRDIGTLDRRKFFVSGILEHELNDGYVLRYSGSYMDQEENSFFDGIAPPGSLGGVDPVLGDVANLNIVFGQFENVITEEWYETSHTVRLLSPDDGPLIWSFGGNYYDSDNTNITPNVFFVENFAPATNTTGLNRVEAIRQWALFGDVSYLITDQVRISAEGRYQREKVTREAVPDALFSSQRLGSDISRTEGNFNPRVTLSYEPNTDNHFYILYAEGNKSGRFNLSGRSTLADGSSSVLPDGTRSPSAFDYVEPESLQNYEAGWKGTLLDGILRANVAVFYQDVDNQQFVSTVQDDSNPTGFDTRLANVGSSEIYGFEADFAAQVTEQFVLQGAVGFNHQEFKNDIRPQEGNNTYIFQLAGDPVGQETLRGKTFANVARWSANMSATYTEETDIIGANEWSVRSDVQFRGRRFVDNANLAYIPSHFRVNLRGTLTGENWVFSVFADNLLDNKNAYRGNAFPCGLSSVTDPQVAAQLGLDAPAPAVDLPSGQRCLSLVPSRSREIGASLQFNF